MGFDAVIKKAFPFISAAAGLGGPVGTIAAAVIGKALGVDKPPAATADGISAAIAGAFADPTQRAALLQAEQTFQLQMTELGYKDASDLEAAGVADRANARSMQIQTRSHVPGALAGGVTAGFFGLLLLIALRATPPSSEQVLNVMTGSLGTAWIMVITYYFGSSMGSDRKTELMADSTTAAK